MKIHGNRILCVCNGGNCRSVALAEVLKGVYGKEAIAAGTFWIGVESMAELCRWADLILPVEPKEASLPERDLIRWRASPIWLDEFAHKRTIFPLGPDVWGHHKWEEIKSVCRDKIGVVFA